MNEKTNEKKGIFIRFLFMIEKYGNKLPDPVTIFLGLAVLILIFSAIGSTAGLSAINPATDERIEVVNLLSGEGISTILTNFTSTFAAFPPLGFVLVIMIGVGLAESTGLLKAAINVSILKVHKKLIVASIVFVGMMSNVAGDAAFIIIPPLAGMIFYTIGRHPLAGVALGYASVAGGFSANLLINTTDVVLVGFTQTAAETINPDYLANPAMNYYFIAASTIMLVPVAVLVNKYFVEPHLGKYMDVYEEEKIEKTTKSEMKALKWAFIAILIFVGIIIAIIIPENSFLRNQETGSLIDGSPFMASIVPLTMFLFLLPSLVFGIMTKKFKSDKEIVSHMNKAMAGMGGFIIFMFAASQMIAFFDWSNLGQITAINGARLLENTGITGFPLLVSFVLLAASINFMISSNAGKWALLAPVFIPMFMLLNIDPAMTQAAYRIGDSVTNTITPMMAYFVITLTYAKKYEPKLEIGRFMSILIPYSIMFLIAWLIFMAIWYFLDLPVGPGFNIHLN